MAKIDDYLTRMLVEGASDLHLIVGAVPKFRIRGELEPIDGEQVLTQDYLSQLLFEIVTPTQKTKFQQTRDLDFAYSIEGTARFRCNYFNQRLGFGAVFRIIPQHIKTIEELRLPKAIEKLGNIQKGLVLVTGPTGSGKSTTLAAIIDMINTNDNKHILTIEDPIEFVHQNRKCLIRQREVGADTKTFGSALRAALREDVDVVLVGEMRDLETIALAITLAETGVLVFGTLHTNSAAKTIDRIIDVFPPQQQEQVRVMIADSLRAIVAQQLLPTKDGKGRVAALEILFGSPALGNVIREGKTEQILSVIQGGKGEGMQSLDAEMLDMINRNIIGAEEAYMRAQDKKIFEPLLTKAFWEASAAGQLGRVQAMIKEGVAVDVRDDGSVTALMYAAAGGHVDVARALIEAAADVNAKDSTGGTALIRAAQQSAELVRILIAAGADVNVRDSSGMSALMRGTQKENLEIVTNLIGAGADVNIKNSGGYAALNMSATTGSTIIIGALIAAGADVNNKDNLSSTPLMRAAIAGHTEVVRQLLAAGAQVDQRDKSERTPLMYAVEKGHVEITQVLIQGGADVNARARGGITPLMWAAKNNPEVVRLLIDSGADVNAKTPNEYTALRFAEEARQMESAALLRDAGGGPSTPAQSSRPTV